MSRCPIYRFELVRERSEPYTGPVRTASQVAELAGKLLPDDAREHFWTLLLDARNRLTGAVPVSVGSLTASLVHPREAFRAAIAAAASAVVFVHNHPSGDPTPSRDDNELTGRLWEAGKVLGIRVLDHVIVGGSYANNCAPSPASTAETSCSARGSAGSRGVANPNHCHARVTQPLIGTAAIHARARAPPSRALSGRNTRGALPPPTDHPAPWEPPGGFFIPKGDSMDNHLTLITLGQVRERVAVLARHCRDELVPVIDLELESLDTVRIAGEPYPLRPAAQVAIANRLGVPVNYLRKCPQWLQRLNLRHWLGQEPSDRMLVRFDGDEVRALFTPKCRPIDHLEVLGHLEAVGFKDQAPVQCRLDAEFLSLAIPDGRRTFAVRGTDRITPGISIANSEVGLLSLTQAAHFLRWVCANGMVGTTQASVGYRDISERVLTELPRAMAEVGRELDQKQEQFALSVKSQVRDPHATMASFNRRFGLRTAEQEALKWAWPFEAGRTLFHVVNTYTRAAHQAGLSAESSYRLEHAGGRVLSTVRAPHA